ncbi:Protein CBG27323 [Caenorhabditis briggsae]|uniref:Protein CBG27323 n=1 Tax=Caenorhabditis briggsae TaxID=6238 RepID=B6IG55_CAEBR|nr:Protein CBG27323 [Caenorhabditis briggsae]CAR98885.1 Protein CBG27323 [Caenorhabditis briggsae]
MLALTEIKSRRRPPLTSTYKNRGLFSKNKESNPTCECSCKLCPTLGI